MIKSLAIIPHLTCARKCTYCYEKHKEYGKALSISDFHQRVQKELDFSSDIEEVLIDANVGKPTNRAVVISLATASLGYDKKVIITTVPRELPFYAKLPVKFHVSLHNFEDIRIFSGLHRRWFRRDRKVESVSVMVKDLARKEFFDYFVALVPKTVPVYLLIDKFGTMWKDIQRERRLPTDENPLKALLTTQKAGYDVTMDHCLMTVLNHQECPASTQLNIYRDGTARLCPYETKPEDESMRERYSHGLGLCYFNQRRG